MWDHQLIEKLRAETPGTQHKIHLNNAGAALMPNPVIHAINNYLKLESITGGYESANMEKEAIHQAYVSVANLLKTNYKNIALTLNATDSFARAISSIPFKNGDYIVTTDEDYVSNQITFLLLAKRFGVKLIRISNTSEGVLDLQAMEEAIKKYQPRLVSVTHIPTNSGLIQPVAEVGKMCRENEVIYLVDGCQSIGQLALDVEEIQCDFLSGTARKFLRGPRGMGFLYISDRILKQNYSPLMLDMRGADWVEENQYQLRSDARRYELWEFSYALVLGMGAAAKYASSIGMANIEQRVKKLANYTRESLSDLNNVSVLDRGNELCGIVTAEIKNWKREDFKPLLDQKSINTSITDINSAKISFGKKGVEWALRVSPHYYNTTSEIDTVVDTIREILK